MPVASPDGLAGIPGISALAPAPTNIVMFEVDPFIPGPVFLE